jgi:hypothetical protein
MESTSSGFDEAVGLYRESKMHAVSVLNDLDESLLPNDPIVDSIKLRAQSMLDLRNACASDDGWILQKESHSVRTLYKNQPETPNIHSVRLDGDVDSPVFFVLALLHEVDLFTKWIPSYSLLGLSFANCVHHPSPTELFVHMQVAIPWPFTNRYSFFKCDGIDCMDDEVPQIGVILSVR